MKFAKCNNMNQNMAPSNNVENKSKSKKNYKEEISLNLSLNGSQINLANRVSTSRDLTPLSSSRALFLPSSRCTFLKERPMSAVPELHAYKAKDENRFVKINNSLRPQSADNIPSGKQKNSGSLEFFECGPHSKLNSTKLLNKLMKEPVMRSWHLTVTSQDTSRTSLSDSTIDEEVMDHSEDTTETNEEEDECIQSEISFGTKIQNLAQRNSSMNLEPGIKHKPPLPQNKQRSLSPKKSDLLPPPGVSMSKDYQEKYHSKSNNNTWDNFVTPIIEEEKSTEEIDFSTQKEMCDNVGTSSIESKIDMYFQLSGNDNKIKEIEIFEQETDYLFKKLRSHQKAFTEYYEISKKLPEIIENEVGASANLDNSNPNSSHREFNDIDDLENNATTFNNQSEVFMDEINDLIKQDFVEMNKHQQKEDEIQNDNVTNKPSKENLKFSLDMYDKGLQKDKEFLLNSSSKFDDKNDNKINENVGNSAFEIKNNEQKISDLIEKPELSVMPEREFSSKKKKAESVQNMLSTLPSTYNDISSILQILENDNNNNNGKFNTSQTDYGNKSWIPEKQDENTGQRNTTVDMPIKDLSNNLRITPSKNYNEILTFLDEVDKSCSVILNAAKIRAYSVQKSTEKLINGALPNMEALLQMNRVDLAQKLIGLYLELEEKTSSVQLLQETLNEQRQSTNKMLKSWESDNIKKLKTQKTEYETAIKRHQTFIDQLINEKKSLTEQCENLIRQLKQQDERHASAMKAAEHRFNVELQASKERQVIAEKLRREKWLLGKTEKIKEMTVKGLEPELHNMKVRHEQEISEIRTLHKQEIEELELRASRRTHQQCETLREQLKTEYDEILQKERESLNQKVQKTIETEEKNYQEERRRLVSEQERLKQHLQEEYASKSREFDTRLETAIKEKERAFEAIKTGYEDHIDTMIRKHKNELKALKENYDIEQESWKANIRKEQEQWKLTKEKEIMAMCKKERDHEIELVIERLENESIELRKQIETTAENRIKRLNEKYLNEIKYLEESEKQAQKRYLEAKNQLVNNENDLIYLRGVIKKMENKLQDLEEENSQLLKERSQVQEVIRKELESEMKSLQTQLINLRSEREREMEEVYERVKSVISKKDGTIAKMKQEYTLLEEKCEHLDQLLKNQRKTYLLEAK